MEKPKVWTKDFSVLAVSNLFNAIGVHMLVPTIPLYIVFMGGTETQVGMVATAFFFASILTRLLLNLILQRVGKKAVLLGGVLLTAIVIASFGLTDSILSAAALRLAHGIGFGITSALFATLAADTLPDSRRGEGIGYFGLGSALAPAIAPAIGFWFINRYGFHPMFLAAAGFPLVSFFGVSFFSAPPEIRRPASEEKTAFWRNLFDPRLAFQTGLLVLLGICRSADMNFIALFARERGLEHLSWYFLVQTLSSASLRFAAGRISDQRGRDWVLIPGGCAVLCSLLLLPLTRSTGLFLVAAFFSGLGLGALIPGMQVWMFSTLEPEKRNIASATYFNFYDIGISLGAIVLGALAENCGYSVLYFTAASAAGLYLVIYLWRGRSG